MTLRWNGALNMDQKVCLSLVKKDQLCAIALVNRKLILKVLQPFEVVFYSIDANTSFSFTKQDLTAKQGYRASFCFVLCNEPKFW